MRFVTPVCLMVLLGSAARALGAGADEFTRPLTPAVDQAMQVHPFDEFVRLEPDSLEPDPGMRFRWAKVPRRAQCGGCLVNADLLAWFEHRTRQFAPFDEFVELEADSLKPYPEVASGWNEVHRRTLFRLADSSLVVLDRHSPPGIYELDDWRLLEVTRGEWGAVRWCTRPRLSRALGFRTSCRRRAGLVASAGGDTSLRSDAQVLEAFFRRHQPWIGGVSARELSPGPFAVELPPRDSWRISLPLPDAQERFARVTWLTFDADPESVPRQMVDLERRWVHEDSAGTDRWHLSATPPRPDVLANARVVGSVLVDLRSGRVVQRRGDVR